MARLTEEQKERLRDLTVAVVLEARTAALRAGASPLKVWDQVQDRMRLSARTCASVEEWGTSLCRSLQLAAPGSYLSSALASLAGEVQGMGAAPAWLDLVEREFAYLVAAARLQAESRKRQREAQDRDQDHGPQLVAPREHS